MINNDLGSGPESKSRSKQNVVTYIDFLVI